MSCAPASRRRGDERGSALVEFALVGPLLFVLALGMFTGGLTYNRKISLTNAVREASRYGATVAPTTSTFVTACGASDPLRCWLATVADVLIQNASGDLSTGLTGRTICVSYVSPSPSGTLGDQTMRLVRAADGTDTITNGSTCTSDGRTEKRVQVVASRPSTIQAAVYADTVTLRATSVTRFEAG